MRPYGKRSQVMVAVCGLWAAHAAAQTDIIDLPLENLVQMQVTTASRYAQTALEAPAAVSVVTADDIRLFGYRTLADVLASMRGLYVSYDRTYHYLGTRGFATPGDYNTRVLLLVNGVRFNDNLYDQATIGTDFPLDLDLVDRVEFVPGPGSAVYGANAFFGVVNVITRDGQQLAGPQVSAQLASQGAAQVRFSFGTVDTYGTDWLVSATRSSTRGLDQYYPFFDSPSTNFGVAQHLDYDRSTKLFAQLRNGGFRLSLAHGERNKGVPTAAFFQVFNDPRSRYEDTVTRAAAEYTTQLTPSLAFTGRLHAGYHRALGDYVYDYGYPSLTVNRDVGTGQWWGSDLQWVSTALARHKLSWGFDYRRDVAIRQRNFDLAPAAEYLDTRRRGDVLGLYLQDEFALSPDLTLHAGLRWDKHSGSAGTVNPRLGLVYWWTPVTAVKLLHGSAYRPPNAYERDYRVDSPGGVMPGDPVGSERVRTSELAVEHALNSTSRVVVTAFRSHVTDLISLAGVEGTEMFTFNNTRGVRVHGLEGEIDHRSPGGTRLRLAYGWQRARDTSADGALANSPQHLLKAQWSDSLRFSEAWPWRTGRYALEVIGIGSRRTPLNVRLPARAVANLTLSARVDKADLSVGVYNLFDHRGSDSASLEIQQTTIAQDGRTFRLKMTYAF